MRGLYLIPAAAVAMAAAVPADATSYSLRFTGKITGGTDALGLFGAAGADLTGKAFTVGYILNIPAAGAYVYDDGTRYETYGGSTYGGGITSPVQSATLSIGTKNLTISSNYYGDFGSINGSGNANYNQDQVYVLVQNASVGSLYSDFNDTNNVFDANIQPFTYNFVQSSNNFSGGYFIYDNGNGSADYISLAATTVSLKLLGAVPEPASWAMMVGGFGLLGGALRRRPAAARLA